MLNNKLKQYFLLGSRGDIELSLALEEMLKDKEWDVVYAFSEQFRELVKNDKFYGLFR